MQQWCRELHAAAPAGPSPPWLGAPGIWCFQGWRRRKANILRGNQGESDSDLHSEGARARDGVCTQVNGLSLSAPPARLMHGNISSLFISFLLSLPCDWHTCFLSAKIHRNFLFLWVAITLATDFKFPVRLYTQVSVLPALAEQPRSSHAIHGDPSSLLTY